MSTDGKRVTLSSNSFTARQFELIGRIAVSFNAIEAIMDFYGPTFVRGPISAGRSLAEAAKARLDEQKTFSRKTECLNSILRSLRENSVELSTQIDAILGRLGTAKALSLRRNRIVHSDMVLDRRGQLVLESRGSPIDASEEVLERFVAEISEFVDLFCLDCHDLYRALSLLRGYSY